MFWGNNANLTLNHTYLIHLKVSLWLNGFDLLSLGFRCQKTFHDFWANIPSNCSITPHLHKASSWFHGNDPLSQGLSYNFFKVG